MKILVTGATGFIGSHLCQALLAAGHSVRAFHRPTSPLLALADLPVEHALGDITLPATLEQAMQGIEVVFHAAAIVAEKTADHTTTVLGARNALNAAAQAGVQRVVHTSSVAALGVPNEQGKTQDGARFLRESSSNQPSPLLMDENHTWNFSARDWPYGYAKYLAEMEVQSAVARGLDVVMVNPAVVVGGGDLNRVSGDVIIHVARRHIPVAPPGGLNVVHIDDVVHGHLAALERGRTGQRYILGGENLTHWSFLKLIAEITRVPPPILVLPGALLRLAAWPLSWLDGRLPLPVSGRDLHRAGYYFCYDTRKAHSELGLPEPLSTRQAVQEAADWYRLHSML